MLFIYLFIYLVAVVKKSNEVLTCIPKQENEFLVTGLIWLLMWNFKDVTCVSFNGYNTSLAFLEVWNSSSQFFFMIQLIKWTSLFKRHYFLFYYFHEPVLELNECKVHFKWTIFRAEMWTNATDFPFKSSMCFVKSFVWRRCEMIF